MPSASAKFEKQTSSETYDPIKQIVTIVEKKVRNLEKRKGKLDSYKLDSQNGKELNEDQKKAIEKYDQVLELLDLAKDLQKQFHGVVQENNKAQKKAAKRDLLERQQFEMQRIKEIMVIQDLLNSMGNEDVRQDFLEGNKGAVKLSEAELNFLDELYKVFCPERDPDSENTDFDHVLATSAEHIQALLDGKNKEAFGTTYKVLKETLQKIHCCNYFNKSGEISAEDCPLNSSVSDESEDKDTFQEQLEQQTTKSSEVEEFPMSQNSEDFSVQESTAPYYTPGAVEENNSVRPIQEVLSGKGNLNFLQESQIEMESSRAPAVPLTPSHMAKAAVSSYGSVPYSVSSPLSAAAKGRPTTEEQQQSLLSAAAPSPSVLPADFDPGRPIPTQTYTNQSFTSVVHHPMMASYVPAAALAASHHVMQAMPQRSPVQQQQANVHSLCVQMNQMSSETTPTTLISQPAQQHYDCNEVQEVNVIKHVSSYGNNANSTNHSVMTDVRGARPNVAYPPRAALDYGQERAYPNTNNNQAYMNRESYVDNSSYSSNLKRGLTSRAGARSGTPRGNSARGGRIGYRN